MSDGQRHRLAVWSSWASIASLVLGVLTALAGTRYDPWRWLFWVIAVGCVVITARAVFSVRTSLRLATSETAPVLAMRAVVVSLLALAVMSVLALLAFLLPGSQSSSSEPETTS